MLTALVTAFIAYTLTASSQPGRQPDSLVVQGRVVSRETRTPIAGASVGMFVEGKEAGRVRTNEQGRFAVRPPERATYDLRVTKAGFLRVQLTRQSSDGNFDIELVRSAAIAGHLYDDRGQPISGAVVMIEPAGEAGGGGASRRADTDDLGAFRIGGLESGRYLVSASPNSVTASSGIVTAGVPQRLVQLRPGQEGVVDLVREPPPPAAVPSFPPGVTAASVITMISPDGRQTVVAVSGMAPGRGAIAGRVSNLSGRLDLVSVRLESIVAATGQRSIALTPVDATGRYEFSALRAGTYKVTVQVPDSLFGTAGLVRSAVVRDGERVDGLDFDVPLRSVVTGTITDEWGDPVEGLTVQLWRVGVSNGRMVVQPSEVGRARKTDDRGAYRLYGLVPGTYYAVAIDESSAPLLQNLGLKAMPRRYAPGTTALEQAARLRVDAGQELSGIDIRWEPLRGASITGVARLSTGQPVNGTAVLIDRTPPGAAAPYPRATPIGSGGTFEFRDVPRGEYVVQVLAKRQWGSSEEFGSHEVSVAGPGTAMLTIVTTSGSSMTGRIIFEGGPAPATSTGFQLTAHPSRVESSPVLGIENSLTARTQIRSNWEFQMTNLFGTNRIGAQALEGWWLKSITVDGINAADEPYTFMPGRSPSDVQVVFARGTATLTGRLVTANDQPVPDRAVVLLSTDPSRVYPGSRHMALAASAQDGSFSLSGMLPGDYWIAPLDPADSGAGADEWQNPDGLNRALAAAHRVTITSGRRTSVIVRTSP